MARWKALSVAVLSSLVLVLVRVNYLLMKELGPAGGGGTRPTCYVSKHTMVYDEGE
jgi:hypothetical protein